ncbi:MAG: biotin synthase BioB [Fibrobacteraceae bacterium]
MEWNKLSHRIIQGLPLRENEAYDLAEEPESSLFDMMSAADMLRRHFKGNRIHTCSFLNEKFRARSENCAYCAQNDSVKKDPSPFPLVEEESFTEHAQRAEEMGVTCFGMVASDYRFTGKDLDRFVLHFKQIKKGRTKYCASLGMLSKEDFLKLKECGVNRIHHNLETSRTFFPNICSLHSYDDRLQTIQKAQNADLAVCSGGLFGLGETDRDVVDLALELRGLHVDFIPVNFLIPALKIRFENKKPISPRRALKIIALMRLINPRAEIIVGCGREQLLGELHPLVFFAGASGIIVGDFSTCKGRNKNLDKAMLDGLGLEHSLK